MFDEEKIKDIWYQGIVTEVPEDDKTNDACDFLVKYKGFDDTYEVKLVEKWKNQCVIILGKVDVFESPCSHLNFRYCASFEQEVFDMQICCVDSL